MPGSLKPFTASDRDRITDSAQLEHWGAARDPPPENIVLWYKLWPGLCYVLGEPDGEVWVGFLQSFFLCFPEWVTSQGANTDSGSIITVILTFMTFFSLSPGLGAALEAQAQTTESKHGLSEVRDTRQVFINLLVTNHKDTISLPSDWLFYERKFIFVLVTFSHPGVDISTVIIQKD